MLAAVYLPRPLAALTPLTPGILQAFALLPPRPRALAAPYTSRRFSPAFLPLLAYPPALAAGVTRSALVRLLTKCGAFVVF